MQRTSAILLALSSTVTAWADDGVDLRIGRGSAQDEIKLEWTGGRPDFEVFRAPMPQDVVSPIHSLGMTSGNTWTDSPPPVPLACYLVVPSCAPDYPDVCDGVDNDCDAASADGSEDPQQGQPCDGTDGDLCTEGSYFCHGGRLVCSDNSGTTSDQCNGLDDDCDPASSDGSEAPWVGQPCDGGSDGDLCEEGHWYCDAGSSACDDNTPTSNEECNAIDDDCDGLFNESFIQNNNPACDDYTYLGWMYGDQGATVFQDSGYNERRFWVTLYELLGGPPINVRARVELTSPPGVDFDLYVTCFNCGATPTASSTVKSLTGHTDVVTASAKDENPDVDSFVFFIEVRYFGSAPNTCAIWDLKVTGNTGGGVLVPCN